MLSVCLRAKSLANRCSLRRRRKEERVGEKRLKFRKVWALSCSPASERLVSDTSTISGPQADCQIIIPRNKNYGIEPLVPLLLHSPPHSPL